MRPVVARLLVAAMIAAMLQLGIDGFVAHADDGCNDGSCSSLQCDMAAGSGCASPCAHAMAAAADRPTAAEPAGGAPISRVSHRDLRLKDQPFRPPILA